MAQPSWNEYQRLVLHELKRLNANFESLAKEQHAQHVALERLKIKSSFIATISGFLAALGFSVGKHFYDFR